MSGHSKWKTQKNKKAAADAVKGRAFTKATKEITVAAKDGGGDPDVNPRLRFALAKAREVNMPKDNIEKAIKKGTGELPGVIYETINYEIYGPGGVAIMVEALTDNKNRASAEIKNILSRKGGNMAGPGAVARFFHKKGLIVIEKTKIDEDKLMDIALNAGAEDMKTEDKIYEITTDPKDFEKVKKALDDNKIECQLAEVTSVPTMTVKVAGGPAKQVLALVEALEDYEDVQNVYANFDIPDEILEQAKQE
ncbi:MAG: YebC/PmpR family DNA-binding transcriptional regulator [Candidatus Omnitrophica bacterium]|nr:YebC/PmpR family DNA-binding transcriptional regulator [Candidatus Omnitrophota bacterium]MDD5310492.1 YebC/PmpR family DNA-binding transcriptional regulator [Candidatus Omnitrophota bacterium]MDD5546664.1 YebC/PmpR family DNA-binding transcriptional regulator [Candidatus Omnitrophota bacterium]